MFSELLLLLKTDFVEIVAEMVLMLLKLCQVFMKVSDAKFCEKELLKPHVLLCDKLWRQGYSFP